MDIVLSPAEARVLGALIEKQVTTPEYYPLTLNALTAAAPPTVAAPLVEAFEQALRALGARVETGRFRADMHLSLTNDGPVTFWLES